MDWRDGHSSRAFVTKCLSQPTRTTSLDRTGVSPASSLFGFAPGGVYHATSVTRRAVSSYPTLSPLPQPVGRFAFCGTVPGVAPAGCYPAPFIHGARTFLCRGLSAIAAATIRPTDSSNLPQKAPLVKHHSKGNLDCRKVNRFSGWGNFLKRIHFQGRNQNFSQPSHPYPDVLFEQFASNFPRCTVLGQICSLFVILCRLWMVDSSAIPSIF